MSSFSRILLIDDDRACLHMLTKCLDRGGYRTMQAEDGQSGLNLALEECPDLVVLDLDMPRLNGLEVCRELRRLDFEPPILMLTGRGHTTDKVTGLEAGADDYLAKPFSTQEFMARVHALLRRQKRQQQQILVLKLGNVQVNFENKTATRDGLPLMLTKTEYALLDLLAKNADQPVSRQTMLDIVWGYARFPSTRTVDTHIWRLRKKIGDDGEPARWIQGVQGEGYRLTGAAIARETAV